MPQAAMDQFAKRRLGYLTAPALAASSASRASTGLTAGSTCRYSGERCYLLSSFVFHGIPHQQHGVPLLSSPASLFEHTLFVLGVPGTRPSRVCSRGFSYLPPTVVERWFRICASVDVTQCYIWQCYKLKKLKHGYATGVRELRRRSSSPSAFRSRSHCVTRRFPGSVRPFWGTHCAHRAINLAIFIFSSNVVHPPCARGFRRTSEKV